VTSSLKSNLATYPAWPEHKKVISKWDGNKFMRHSHFCQIIDELHLTLIRDRVIMLTGDNNGGRAVLGNVIRDIDRFISLRCLRGSSNRKPAYAKRPKIKLAITR
jgi:hypothetical protein